MVKKDEKPNISVSFIIPSYNVQSYIEKCISSIMNQTRRDIEIIIINDGSTDGTKEILERIAKTDDRVTVINKQNEGVSAARNTGIEASKGEYLAFVDGDDYISEDYAEYMLNLVKETNAEFCMSSRHFTKKNEKQTSIDEEKIITMSPEEATAYLLSPDVVVYSPNKLIKRDLIINNNLSFSSELFYGEGLTFVTTLSQYAKKICLGNRKVYYYRRNNDKSATTKFDVQKIYNGEKAIKNIAANMKLSSEKIDKMLKLHLSTFYIGAIVRVILAKRKKEYFDDYKKWLSYIRQHTRELVISSDISMYRKLLLTGTCISPYLLSKLYMLRRKKVSSQSV